MFRTLIPFVALILLFYPGNGYAAEPDTDLLKQWKAEFHTCSARLMTLFLNRASHEELGRATLDLMDVYTNIIMEARENGISSGVSLPSEATFETLPGLLIRTNFEHSRIDTRPETLFKRQNANGKKGTAYQRIISQ